MDRQWVKILAQSQLEAEGWRLHNPAAAREHSRHLLQKTVTLLFQEMKEAVAVFNEYCRQDKKMSMFPVFNKEREAMHGFVLVIGRLQLQLVQNHTSLDIVLSRLHGFHQTNQCLHHLEAHCDPFGGISWIMDEKSIMTEDMLVKQMLHDLCREAHASEWT
jgi:hypothetical protein